LILKKKFSPNQAIMSDQTNKLNYIKSLSLEERNEEALRLMYKSTMQMRKESLDLLLSLEKREGYKLHPKYHEENKQLTFEEWKDDFLN
jgi:hypothetical protein